MGTIEESVVMAMDGSKHFKRSKLKIDILNGLTDNEILTLRRIFQERHVNKHNKGIINEIYTKLIPEDNKLLGSKATLSMEEFENAATILTKVVQNMI